MVTRSHAYVDLCLCQTSIELKTEKESKKSKDNRSTDPGDDQQSGCTLFYFQSSYNKPLTQENSRTLFVTSVLGRCHSEQ